MTDGRPQRGQRERRAWPRRHAIHASALRTSIAVMTGTNAMASPSGVDATAAFPAPVFVDALVRCDPLKREYRSTAIADRWCAPAAAVGRPPSSTIRQPTLGKLSSIGFRDQRSAAHVPPVTSQSAYPAAGHGKF
jgi:hypothetical protein